jgi:hypothetical protein
VKKEEENAYIEELEAANTELLIENQQLLEELAQKKSVPKAPAEQSHIQLLEQLWTLADDMASKLAASGDGKYLRVLRELRNKPGATPIFQKKGSGLKAVPPQTPAPSPAPPAPKAAAKAGLELKLKPYELGDDLEDVFSETDFSDPAQLEEEHSDLREMHANIKKYEQEFRRVLRDLRKLPPAEQEKYAASVARHRALLNRNRKVWHEFIHARMATWKKRIPGLGHSLKKALADVEEGMHNLRNQSRNLSSSYEHETLDADRRYALLQDLMAELESMVEEFSE